MLSFKKKNLIALALVTIMAVSGLGVYKTQAAGKIDDTKTCTVTVEVKTDTGNPFSNYEDFVTVRLYKVADVELTGQLTLVEPCKNIDISALSKDKVTAADTEAVAAAAYKAFKLDDEDATNDAKPTASVLFDMSDVANAIEPVDRGLYLFVPQPTQDDLYDYTFKYSLISVPTSNYISATKVDEDGNVVAAGGSDAWSYNATITLKPEAAPRYGKIDITKTLKTFNASLGTASFVYSVEGVKDDKVVFSDVYTMNFKDAGTQKIPVKKIPAGAVVTVKEVYSGASYTADAEVGKEKTGITIVADETKEAEFVNDYDDRLVVGGLSIENHFVKNNDENISTDYQWDGSNLTDGQMVRESEGE